MECVTLAARQLDYLERQDPYLKPLFNGVFPSDQLPKEKDIQTRSSNIVNEDTHEKQGSPWLSIYLWKMINVKSLTVMDYHSIGINPPPL